MAYSLRRFSKWYIQYKTNLFQPIQIISTILCVPMDVINQFFIKTFKMFTKLLYGFVDMMENVVVNVQKLQNFVLIWTVDDIINFQIFLGSTSKAMVDRGEKSRRQKYKNLNISRTKRAF